MRTIDKRLTAKLAPVLVKRAPTLTLPFDARCKSRLAATLDSGEEVALVMPRGTVLADGDMLVADDGGFVRVVAAAEDVLVVRAPSVRLLTRAAYHLGNRHTPVEVGADYLKLEADAVLEDMLKRLGVLVAHETQPFQPETGAYGGGHKHGHDETFSEDYALAQKVFDEHHGHAHDAHDHAHDHSSCGHDHSHDHDHSSCGHDHSHDHDHDHDHGHKHHGHAHR
ncbi:urease accessory protein UreE [Caballeronia sp. LZ035]|uniref:urease accessory protein UreE n=1 Tax=Caballeronia sp. LZ035 TaxID=3038568 RepID=UPI002859829A|nr:urease accessory protein UreE [Caballeronia sp. LZ035]MDR5757840.1 urease accessory protein UreE [Caballeronia sp. LZ035]